MSTRAYAVKVDIPAVERGDKWHGIASIGPILINGATPVDSLVRVRMHFAQGKRNLFRLDSDASTTPDAPIVIDDAAAWTAHVPEVGAFLPLAGSWEWDMELYGAGWSGPLTLYYGTLSVTQDVTKDQV